MQLRKTAELGSHCTKLPPPQCELPIVVVVDVTLERLKFKFKGAGASGQALIPIPPPRVIAPEGARMGPGLMQTLRNALNPEDPSRYESAKRHINKPVGVRRDGRR